jgi:putative RecB family exonuclease
MQCSLKYRFQYIDKIPRPFKSSGLAFGSALHSAISWLHKERMKGNDVTADRLSKIFEADWYCQKLDNDIRYKEGEEEMKLVIMGKEMLNMYFLEAPKKVKGSEISFSLPLVNPVTGQSLGINFDGFIDLMEDENTIVEFKTSHTAMSQNDVDNHLQLSAYSYAYEILNQRLPRVLKIVDFVKTKKPKMLVFETTRAKKDIERFFALASHVLRSIRTGIFYPKESFMCKDCEFTGPCKGWTETAYGITTRETLEPVALMTG